jgi:hypothetical protein
VKNIFRQFQEMIFIQIIFIDSSVFGALWCVKMLWIDSYTCERNNYILFYLLRYFPLFAALVQKLILYHFFLFLFGVQYGHFPHPFRLHPLFPLLGYEDQTRYRIPTINTHIEDSLQIVSFKK